ncbi:MAG TPA: hypothetical protein VHL11_00275, partial [Phototrophicaceae bacterium]|nr:hypothetical protein [Phototrophicaceae bacterium]
MAIEYIYPRELSYDELATLTDDKKLKLLADSHNKCDQQNQRLYQDVLNLHRQMLIIAGQLYGDRSNEIKYLRQRPPGKPMDMAKKWKKLLHRFEQWKADERKRQSSRASYQRQKARKAEAMDYLEAAGLVLHKDFDRYDCLRV